MVMQIVVAPAALAIAMADTMSLVWPEWEIPTATSPFFRSAA